GAQLGILIKGPEVLESTRRVDTVVLDKTGTVTTAAMALSAVHVAGGADRAEVLRLAGAVENASSHPVARAVADAAEREVGPLPEVVEFATSNGLGVHGVVEGHAVVVGRAALARDWALTVPDELAAAQDAAERDGGTAVIVGWDGRARAVLVVRDEVKATSAEAVRRMRALGLRPVLLTGDNEAVARSVATQVGIDAPGDVIAEVLPEDKVA